MALALFFLLFLAFFLLGDKLCVLWRVEFSETGEAFIFCAALGLVAVSCATEALAFLGWISPETAWTLLGVLLISRAGRLSRLARALRDEAKSIRASRPKPLVAGWIAPFSLAVAGALIFLALTLAQTPPTRADALTYHLAVPKAYLENRGVVNLPNNIYSFFPLQFEMIYLLCLALGGEILARLAGLGMAFILGLALAAFYKNVLRGRRAAFVPVLFFLTPTFFELSVTAYVDLAAAGFFFLAYYSWERWREADNNGWLFLMTIFAGAAAATKLTAAILLPLGLLGIAVAGRNRKDARTALTASAVFFAGVAAFLLPWWAKNFHYSGNPFTPLFAQFFDMEGRINWDAERSLQLHEHFKSFGMGRGAKELLLLPINLTFFSENNSLRFDGRIGVLYLLLFPALFFAGRGAPGNRDRIVRLAFLFFVLMAFWFVQFQYVRFLGPAFAFLSLLTAYGLERAAQPGNASPLPQKQNALSGLIKIMPVLAVAGALHNLVIIASAWAEAAPLPYLLGKESREEYLTRRLPIYSMYQAFNRSLGKDDVALFVYMRNLGYLCERKFIGDSVFEAHTLQSILKRSSTAEDVENRFRSLGVTHLMFDNNFVFGKDSAFSPDRLDLLKSFLNSRARLVAGKNGFYLYRFMIN